MKYIVENWFVIVGLIAVCAAGGYAVYVFVFQSTLPQGK